MNIIRKWIRDLFGFSGKEINGFLILLPLMVAIILAQPLYHLWIAGREPDFSTDIRMLDSLMAHIESVPTVERKKEEVPLFEFNPNKASVEDFVALGFTENLATRIASYRQKGGQFRIKSDLMKIYGMDTSFYRRLYPFIMLPERVEKRVAVRDSIFSHKKREQRNDILLSFDLNEADTTRLKSVYGIGTVLARRIVRYRNGLGGFIKVEQLHEVYGLDSVAINRLLKIAYIKEDFVPKKINMNEADEKEFSAHPYIKRNMATAIVAYRFQHGNFARVDDLRKLSQLKEADIVKILPYLRTDD